MTKKAVLYSSALFVLLIACFAGALCLGSAPITPADVFRAITNSGDAQTIGIINQIRLPRALFAALVGGMLALSGALLQALLKNPLVDPFITGISSGAAFGAACAIMAGASGLLAPSMAGAALAMFIVYRISLSAGVLNLTRLLLAGVIMGSFFSSLIMLLNALFSKDLIKVVFWLMGDLSNINPGLLLYSAMALFAAIGVAMFFANDLNILTTGEDEARSMGVRVEMIKAIYFSIAGVLTAVSVALSGVIGFVGLIVPHVVRAVVGPDMRLMIPCSFLAGAIFLLASDTLARTAFLPSEIPVGVITGLVGAPVFIYFMMKGRTQ
jgi:iron complex transport system permease protein